MASISSNVSNLSSKKLEKGVKPILIVIAVILALLLAVVVYFVVMKLHVMKPGSTEKKNIGPKTSTTLNIDERVGPWFPTRGSIEPRENDEYDQVNEPSVCRSEACQAAAEYFKQRMDLEADPCEDFTRYICGGWLKRLQNGTGVDVTFKPLDRLNVNVKNVSIEALAKPIVKSPTNAIDNARAFFQGCMDIDKISDKDGIRNLKTLISKFSEIPLVGIVMDKKLHWVVQVARIYRQLNLHSMMHFNIDVSTNKTDHKKRHIWIQQSDKNDFILSLEVYAKNNETVLGAYRKYITKTLCNLLEDVCSKNNEKVLEKEADIIIDFEKKLVKLWNKDLNSASDNYVKLKELSAQVTEIPWKEYLREILSSENVNDDLSLMVTDFPYFKKLANLLQSTDPNMVSSYLAWLLVHRVGQYAAKNLRDTKREFLVEAYGIEKQTLRADSFCYQFLKECMGFAVSNLYIREAFPMDTIQEVTQITEDVLEAMENIINNLEWMDDNTKTAAIKKLKKMSYKVGFPDWVMDSKALNEYYAMEPVKRRNMVDSYRILTSHFVKKHLEDLHKEGQKSVEWTSLPIDINAFYVPANNSILYTAGYLGPPVIWSNGLKVLNYGAIGHVAGHEITHGFDTDGKNYDEEGDKRNWWTNSSLQLYNERVQCFIQRYGSFNVRGTNVSLNSKLSIGEDIADNGGLREAYAAYFEKERPDERLPGFEDITPEQLFFIGYAGVICGYGTPHGNVHQVKTDPHTINEYRTWLPASNFEKFSEAFNCKIGNKMNPEKKCVVWG